MILFNKIGKMALATRLRMLSERMMEEAEQIYTLYDIELKPKWFPVFYVLSEFKKKSITSIAREIGHSHPSVSAITREMVKAGIVKESKDKKDGRKNMLELTEKGKALAVRIQVQYEDINSAVEEALSQTQHDVWKAMSEFEYLLDQKSMLERVREHRKIRESKRVKIVPYELKYRQHFRELNEEWILKYFKIENEDRKILEHPKENILDKRGAIIVALLDNQPIGVCALIKMKHPNEYELGKMAVSPKAQGLGIGYLLGKKIIEKAIEFGGTKVHLESNTVLKPAIKLYEKLGFQKVAGHPTPYERCNIQMELLLI
jgi:DNA-binding MarR family transcriptional regulator